MESGNIQSEIKVTKEESEIEFVSQIYMIVYKTK